MGTSIMLALVVAALACAWLWHTRRSLPADERWRPRALRNAQLVHAERTFRSDELRIVARLDRAYEDRGVTTLVEFKTRGIARAYPSDIIELSAQRVALEDETGAAVSDVAYVVTQDRETRRRVPHLVRLLSREQVIALVRRRQDVVAGKAAPTPARSARMCASCAHLQRCRDAYGDRSVS